MSFPHTLRSFIAVDTETTGLDFENDRLIELAAVRFEDGRPVADFEALVAPGKALSPVSRLITGLTAEELEAAPPAGETLRAFLAFAGDLPLVAHNAEFDAHFVRRALEAQSLGPVPGVWIDSLLMSRIAWPSWDSHRLDSLAERLNVPRDAEHRALPDARRAGFVFIAAQNVLRDTISPEARADLARLAAPLPDWSLVFPSGDSGEAEVSAGATGLAEDASAPTGSSTPVLTEAEADAAHEALTSEGWLALETSPATPDAQAGLEAAVRAAQAGQRVLLCVPDNFVWNALRKSAAFVSPSSVRKVALAEPTGYLCRERLAALVSAETEGNRLGLGERAALMPLVAWADRNPGQGLMADGRGFSPERSRLTAARVVCAAYADDPAAQAARAAAASAGVILVTHAALCAHLRGGGTLLPACDSVVVTGAQRLAETAQRSLGREAALFRLRVALQLFRLSAEEDAGYWQDVAPVLSNEDRSYWKEAWFEPETRFHKLLQKAGRQAAKKKPAGDSRVRYAESFESAFGIETGPVTEALRANESFLERALETVGGTPAQDLRRVLALLRAFRADFEFLCAAGDAEAVFTFEDVTNPHKATLRSTPVAMQAFGSRLREFFGAAVFLSPALLFRTDGARGDQAGAEAFARGLGLDDLSDFADAGASAQVRGYRAASAPRPAAFLMAPFAPGFSASEPPEAFARFVAETAAPFFEAGIWMFFPSQSALRTAHQALKAVLPQEVPCWAQHVDGNRDAVLRLFASTSGGIVLATEGMPGLKDREGKGPALALVTRMPLPPAHDPVLEARGEILKAEGRNARNELWNAAAVLRLKKEWAGLNASGSGPRAIWLLDARASTEGLGAQAAQALGMEAKVARSGPELAAATEDARKLF